MSQITVVQSETNMQKKMIVLLEFIRKMGDNLWHETLHRLGSCIIATVSGLLLLIVMIGYIQNNCLSMLYNAVKQTGFKISICEYVATDGENPLVDKDLLQIEIWNTEKFYCERNVTATVPWAKLYKKECFREIRYPVGIIHEYEKENL